MPANASALIKFRHCEERGEEPARSKIDAIPMPPVNAANNQNTTTSRTHGKSVHIAKARLTTNSAPPAITKISTASKYGKWCCTKRMSQTPNVLISFNSRSIDRFPTKELRRRGPWAGLSGLGTQGPPARRRGNDRSAEGGVNASAFRYQNTSWVHSARKSPNLWQ
jgi:hypothetical protein